MLEDEEEVAKPAGRDPPPPQEDTEDDDVRDGDVTPWGDATPRGGSPDKDMWGKLGVRLKPESSAKAVIIA
eukprot:gene13111-2090_t